VDDGGAFRLQTDRDTGAREPSAVVRDEGDVGDAPDADNAGQADSTPPSGATLELAAFTVQPTLASPGMYGWVAPAVAGAGIIIPIPRVIVIPAGTGLAIVQRAATIWPTSEVSFVFED